MPQLKHVLTVPKAGLNVPVAAIAQDYYIRCLSIHGPYMALGNGINANTGDFDPDFINLNPAKLRGTGERNGDSDDNRIETITSVAGDVLALRIPLDHPTETVLVEVWAKLPW